MTTPLVSISWCAEHAKVDVGISGQEHAKWLLHQVQMLKHLVDWPIIVACTGWKGMLNVEVSPSSCERDILWEVFQNVRAIVGVPENPGHQVGAALCIRIGLETACKLGYPYLIHTAEDIIPRRETLKIMFDRLEEGYSYVGETWRSPYQGLNTQFFGCRPQSLVGPWDSCRVFEWHHIEGYMRHLLEEGRYSVALLPNESYYHTTHHYDVWRQGVREEHGLVL